MRKLLIILFICYPVYAYTQGWSLEYSLGYGTYQLDDVKSMQAGLQGLNGLKITDDISGNITHTFALGYMTKHHHFGGSFSYLTTGGRLHIADYSGSYTVDMIMNGYRIGAFVRRYINIGFSPLQIYLQLSPGLLFSNLRMEEKLQIYTESAKETTSLNATTIYIEPSAGVIYRLTDWLRISAGCGYEANVGGTLKYSGQKTDMQAHWNGFRLYGGLIFTLPNRN